jgi:hypothetical protein
MNIDEIRYSFHDSPVPPPFHRSYTISIKKDIVQIIVNSYETILTDESYSCSPENFNNILQHFEQGNVRNEKLADNDGYTGGTGETIVCLRNGAIVFSGNVYHCADIDSGNLAGDYSAAVNAIRDLIPDMESLMKR